MRTIYPFRGPRPARPWPLGRCGPGSRAMAQSPGPGPAPCKDIWLFSLLHVQRHAYVCILYIYILYYIYTRLYTCICMSILQGVCRYAYLKISFRRVNKTLFKCEDLGNICMYNDMYIYIYIYIAASADKSEGHIRIVRFPRSGFLDTWKLFVCML